MSGMTGRALLSMSKFFSPAKPRFSSSRNADWYPGMSWVSVPEENPTIGTNPRKIPRKTKENSRKY
eukprot:jgi/Psemu1/58386/gm1.58386_g